MTEITKFPFIENIELIQDPTGFAKAYVGDLYSSEGRFGNGDSFLEFNADNMKSSNFVKGSTGWQILYNGDVEFNDGTFRGDLSATTGTFGGWRIDGNTLNSVNNSIVLDAGNDQITLGSTMIVASTNIQSNNYVSGINGSGFYLDEDLLEVGNIAVRGIIRSAVFQKDVVSAIGGSFAVLDADTLAVDMTALDASTLTIDGNTTFSVNDILRIKDGTDDEWLVVTNATSAPTYTVTRDAGTDYAANTNPAWTKGASVINYGTTGDGGVYMTASETNAPYMSVFTHAGSPWDTLVTRLRLGNLNGYLGYSTDLYGIGIGATGNSMTYEATNGLKITGTITGGVIQTAASGERFLLDGSQGANKYFQAFDGSENQTMYLTSTGQLTLAQHTNISGLDVVNALDGVSVPVVVIRNAIDNTTSSGALLQLIQRGTGNCIDGLNAAGDATLWSIAKTGKITCEGLDAGTNKIENVVDPTEDQEAATKKYVDDNVTGGQLLIKNATAGEALTAGDALFISDGTESTTLTVNTGGSVIGSVYGATLQGQVFLTSASIGGDCIASVQINMKKLNSPSGNLTVSIRATNSPGQNHPTGADLGTVVVAASTISTSPALVTFTFSSPITITAGLKYAVLCYVPDGDISNCIQIYGDAGDPYTDGDQQSGSAETWSSLNADVSCIITTVPIAGKVYKADNDIELTKDHYVGFTESGVNKDATFNLVVGGVMTKSGITVGKVYQLSATRGLIAELTTPSETTKRVGIAIKESSTVKLLVLNSYITN